MVNFGKSFTNLLYIKKYIWQKPKDLLKIITFPIIACFFILILLRPSSAISVSILKGRWFLNNILAATSSVILRIVEVPASANQLKLS